MKRGAAIVPLRTLALVVGLALCTFLGGQVAPADDVFSHPSSARALSETLLARPAHALAQAKSLRGKFIHRKFLPELPAPLVAKGDFLFARDLGIDWHTRTPFESEFILTRAGMLERDEGAESLRLKAAEQPAVRAAAEIFLALFALDLDTLARNFDMFGRSDGKAWELGLRPRAAAFQSVLTQVIVRGANQVESIELRDPGGDRTEIELLDVQLSDSGPSDDERRSFEE